MIKLGFQRIYFRNFLIFIGIFILVFIPFVLLLFSQFSRYTMIELNSNANSKVNNIRYNAEFIFDKLKNNAYTIYNDQTIQNWFFGDPDDVLRTTTAIKTQNNFMFNEPFIARSYLINTKTKKIIDSKKGEVDYASFEDPSILNRTDTEDYLTIFNHAVGGVEYLTMITPASPSKSEYSFLVLMIDKQMIMNYLFGPNHAKGVELFILSSDGNRMLGDTSEELVKTIGQAYQTSGANQWDMKVNGTRWIINEATTKSNWQIYYTVDYSLLTHNSSELKQRIIYFSLTVLALIAALFYWSSRRSLSPLSTLADKLKMKGQKTIVKDLSLSNILTHSEFSYIDKGLDALLDNFESLHSSYREHQDLIRSEQLRQWLFQGKLTQSGREFLSSETQLISRKWLFLAVIRIESYQSFCEQYDFNSRKLLKYAMRNIADEILHGGDNAVECLDMGSDHLLIWMGTDDIQTAKLQQSLLSIQEKVASLIKITTSIAISHPGTADDDFNKLYQHIYELTMLKFIKGENHIFTEEEYEDLMLTLPSFENISEDIILLIRQEQLEEALTKLRQQFSVMAGVSYSECKLHLTLLIYEITKSFGRLSVIQEINGINKILDQYHTLPEVLAWMEKLIRQIVAEISAPKVNGHKEEIVNEIKEFILTNIRDPLLSIEVIADHLSLSVSYLRQLFKGITNISINDFILESKIELVKKLLVSSDLSITEIMESSGFLTKSHFFSVFKKVTGLTPKQYREMLSNSLNQP